MHKIFIFFIFSHVSSTNPRHWRVAEALWRGLNFSRAWWMMELISGEKDCKHVSVKKVVTLNICCNVASLTFHLPHITTGSFQSNQRLEECNIPLVRWKSCAFYTVVQWHYSGVVDKRITVCFLQWTRWITLLIANRFRFSGGPVIATAVAPFRIDLHRCLMTMRLLCN